MRSVFLEAVCSAVCFTIEDRGFIPYVTFLRYTIMYFNLSCVPLEH